MKLPLLPAVSRAPAARRLACAASLALASLPLSAQTVWTGATGDWYAGANWSLGVPGGSSSARIDNGGTAEIMTAGAVAQTVLIGYDVTDSGYLTASGAGSLTVASDLSVGYGGTGTLLVTGGADVSDYSGQVGYTIASDSGATGTATIEGPGSSWNHTYELYVGYGTGTLNVLDGATVHDYYGYLGYYPESPGRSHGTANVDGAGSMWTSDSWFHVGDSGTGVLNVTNAGTVVNGEGVIAFNYDSDGTATVDGAGSLWSSNGYLFVGQNGNGTLHVANGGRVESHGSFSYVAYSAASTSLATIDGAGSVWHNDHGLYVGFDGDGTVEVTNGGALESGFFANIGFSPGASGTVSLAGAGSRFINDGTIAVGGNVSGAGGTGLLHVGAGASVEAGAINVWNTGTVEIGVASGGAGTIHSSSTATLQGALSVGFDAGAYSAGTYTVLTADGGLGGSQFASVSIGTPPAGFEAHIAYDANHVYLVLSPEGVELTVAPPSVDFGTVPAGITAGPAMFTLTSSGTVAVTVNAIVDASSPFVRAGGDCPAPPFDLAPSASCTIGYSFAPTEVGPAAGTVTITHNAGTSTISLAGTGMAGAPTALVLVGGSGQSATVGTAFASPLSVRVEDDWNNPVPNITVTFAAPASGASAVLSQTSVVTDASGVASVTATANGIAGGYDVTANGGLGTPVSFALTNVAAVSDVGIVIGADAYAQRGQSLDYFVTLSNAGPNDATGVAVATALSPLLDVANAVWTCIGPPESGCTATGEGNLADTVNIPSGGSVGYIVSAAILPDAGDGPIVSSATSTLAGDPNGANDEASASTAVVIFRDGFELEALPDVPSAPLADGAIRSFAVPRPGTELFETLATIRASDRDGVAFRIERANVGVGYVRLVARDRGGIERSGLWVAVPGGSTASVGAVEADGERVALLLVAGGESRVAF